MGFEGCGASEWAQRALIASDAGVGEVRWRASMVLTTGSRRAQARERRSLSFGLARLEEEEVKEQIFVASHIYKTTLPCKESYAKCATIQNGRRRATPEDAQAKSRPRGVTG